MHIETVTGDIIYEKSYAIFIDRDDFFKVKRRWDTLKSYKEKLEFWESLDFLKSRYENFSFYYPRFITFIENYNRKYSLDFDYSRLLSINPCTQQEKLEYFEWVLHLPVKQETQPHKLFSLNDLNIEAYKAALDNRIISFIEGYFAEHGSEWDSAHLYEIANVMSFYNEKKNQNQLEVQEEYFHYIKGEHTESKDWNAYFKEECKKLYDERVTIFHEEPNEGTDKLNFILSEIQYFKEKDKDEDESYAIYKYIFDYYQSHLEYEPLQIALQIQAKLEKIIGESISSNEEREKQLCTKFLTHLFYVLITHQVDLNYEKFLQDQLRLITNVNDPNTPVASTIPPLNQLHNNNASPATIELKKAKYSEDIILKDIFKDQVLYKLDPILNVLKENRFVINYETGKSHWINRETGYMQEIIALSIFLEHKGCYDEKKLINKYTIVSALRNQFEAQLSYETYRRGKKDNLGGFEQILKGILP